MKLHPEILNDTAPLSLNNHNDAKGMADACRVAWSVYRASQVALRFPTQYAARMFVDSLYKHETPELREAIAQELIK